MDDQIRRLEREAARGGYEARRAWKRCLQWIGEPDPDQAELEAPATEWEEAQADYDDLWWHSNTPRKCGLWGGSGGWRFYDIDFKTAVFKAHLHWGHLWGGHNSKRKTLRTHRKGSRGRNVRLAYAELCPVPEWPTGL